MTPFDPFAGGPIARTVETTEAQREIWLAVEFGGEDGNLAYNESLSVLVPVPLDVPTLQEALQRVVARHESLRATFSADGRRMIIGAEPDVTLRVDELGALTAAERERARAAAAREETAVPFDLRRGPLLRPRLLQLGEDGAELILTAHHLVCDGWSAGVLLQELTTIYAAIAAGTKPVLSEAPSFTDYAVFERSEQRGPGASADERFWLEALRELTSPLDLPVDHPRGRRTREDGERSRDLRAERYDHTLDAELVAGLRGLGRAQGASLAAVLLTGFASFLSRLSGASDFAIGMPVAGQTAEGWTGLVGHCVQTLPLRVRLEARQSFSDALAACRRELLLALEHRRFSFGTLLQKLGVPRDPSRVPLIPALFNLDQELTGLRLAGQELRYVTNPRVAENFELFVNATQTGGQIVLECTYAAALFDPATIRAWMESFEALLRDAVARPDTPVDRLEILSPSQREEQLVAWNARSARELDLADTVLRRFETHRRDRSAHVAVRDAEGPWTYRELGERVDGVAHRLAELGVQPGDFVAICGDRSALLLVAVLAIWKLRAAYVPFDPGYPLARQQRIAEDTPLAAIVHDGTAPEFAAGLTALDLRNVPASTEPFGGLAASPSDVAYVLHTSGSTGRPKGVVIEQGSVTNFLHSVAVRPGFGPTDHLLAVTTLSFDISVLELYLPLFAGGTVTIADHRTAMDCELLARRLEETGATHLQATPSTWRLLLAADWPGSAELTALNAGEALPLDVARALAPRVGALWNLYGPTETTVFSAAWRVPADAERIAIGTPLANAQLFAFDAHACPVPVGAIGTLFIGGPGVARGYLGREALTRERFVPDPTGPEGARLYDTGDQVRFDATGCYYWLGRADAQVKVRGYRIELGEIEIALAQLNDVERAVATVHDFGEGDVRLLAYVVRAPGADLDTAELLDRLAQELPPQSVPQHLFVIDALPLLPNGKIDRAALPRPLPVTKDVARPSAAPSTEEERTVATIWTELLGIATPDIHADFFTVGGHSLLAVRAVTRIREDFGAQISLQAFMEQPTIAALAARILAWKMTHAAPEPRAGSEREELEF